MDSEKISCHSLEEEQSDANEDVLKKCGHILFTKKHDLKFSCIFCEKSFIHLDQFREHVLNYHIDTLDSTIAFDPSLDIKPELSVSCEYEESFSSCQSYEADMKLEYEDTEIKNEASLDIEMGEDVISTMITQVDQNLEEAHGHSIFPGVDNDQNQNTVGNTTESTLKYSCEFCSDTFNLPENLRSHFEKHHVIEFSHKCSFCDRRYVLCNQKTIHEQITHLGMHKGKKFVQCDICFNTYKDGKTARLHKRRHISGKQEICNICNKIFSQKKHLVKHFSTHFKPYACEICSASFKTEKLLEYHVARHLNPKVYDCKICNVIFTEPYKLRLHKKMHKREKEISRNNENIEVEINTTTMTVVPAKQYQCKTSDQNFLDKQHEAEIKSELFACKICSKKFKTQLDLNLHNEKENCTGVSCNLNLANHQDQIPKDENVAFKMNKTTNSRNSGKEYECETCHEKMFGKANFNHHIAGHPVCEICTKKFKSELGLKLHVENKKCTKNSLQPFDCAICSKTFKSQLGLAKHKKRDNCSSNKSLQHNKSSQHNKSLQHNCSICNEIFADKILFQQHKADHNKEKPLTCDICSKKFASYLGLSLHTEKHSLKKLPCSFCSKTFTDRLKLKAHKKKHSGQNKDLKSKKEN